MITIPQNTIITIPENPDFVEVSDLVVESFKGNIKRDWFIKHAYWCLPLTIGNQYGFGIKALKTFTVEWDGSRGNSGVKVNILDQGTHPNYQSISSHFGMGTVTIQNRFTFRTPPNVNLMTINPPNYWIDGIQHMTGVIETDNLRRDFTFNLKVTRPNHLITIEKGTFIGCVIPIPRYFVDGFELKNANTVLTPEQIQEEQLAMRDFGIERSTHDRKKPHGNGRRYFHGKDVYDTPFPNHQKRIL
jgi:hypothetical protein